MYNAFYYLLSLVMLLQVYSSCIIGFKIDSTIRLINEQMVDSTITYVVDAIDTMANKIKLIEKANEAGGLDNITVIVVLNKNT